VADNHLRSAVSERNALGGVHGWPPGVWGTSDNPDSVARHPVYTDYRFVIKADCVADNEGDGFRFEFARVTRGRPVSMVQQFERIRGLGRQHFRR
jgi:hypothetical protein